MKDKLVKHGKPKYFYRLTHAIKGTLISLFSLALLIAPIFILVEVSFAEARAEETSHVIEETSSLSSEAAA